MTVQCQAPLQEPDEQPSHHFPSVQKPCSDPYSESVKRNLTRFPSDFMFRLSRAEWKRLQGLRSQIAILKPGRGQHRKHLLDPGQIYKFDNWRNPRTTYATATRSSMHSWLLKCHLYRSDPEFLLRPRRMPHATSGSAGRINKIHFVPLPGA